MWAQWKLTEVFSCKQPDGHYWLMFPDEKDNLYRVKLRVKLIYIILNF